MLIVLCLIDFFAKIVAPSALVIIISSIVFCACKENSPLLGLGAISNVSVFAASSKAKGKSLQLSLSTVMVVPGVACLYGEFE